MKKHEWFIVFVPLLITWFLDRVTKQWAVGLDGIQSFGYLGFVLHHNPGAMLGLFSDLPPVLESSLYQLAVPSWFVLMP